MSGDFERSGFTLLEAMVALAVSGLILLTSFEVVGANLRSSREAAHSEEAAVLIEDLFSRTALLSASELLSNPSDLTGTFERPMEMYRWTVEPRPVVDNPDLVEVLMTVSWDGGSIAAETRVAFERAPASDTLETTGLQ